MDSLAKGCKPRLPWQHLVDVCHYLYNANDAKTFLKHFSDCLFYFCSTCVDSIMHKHLAHVAQSVCADKDQFRFISRVLLPPQNLIQPGDCVVIYRMEPRSVERPASRLDSRHESRDNVGHCLGLDHICIGQMSKINSTEDIPLPL